MGTKNSPGSYDCYEKAKPDEPMFILLARDETAPRRIIDWCTDRIEQGLNDASDSQIAEALQCAIDMMQWRKDNWPF